MVLHGESQVNKDYIVALTNNELGLRLRPCRGLAAQPNSPLVLSRRATPFHRPREQGAFCLSREQFPPFVHCVLSPADLLCLIYASLLVL